MRWHCDHQHLYLCVEDDGPGIDRNIRARLLEPFVTTKPVGVGTGLGLAVVNAGVAEHGGHIHIDESPLGGARFQSTLPLQRPNEESETIRTHPPRIWR